MPIRYNVIRNGFWRGFNMKIEPRHDKTNKMIRAPSEDSDQPGHPPSLIRVSAVRLKQTWVLSYQQCTAKTLIRPGGCPGWSESSLGTKVILLFCHEVAQNAFSSSLHMQHIYIFHHFFTFRIEPNMKSFSHANDIVLRRDIYIHSLNWC